MFVCVFEKREERHKIGKQTIVKLFSHKKMISIDRTKGERRVLIRSPLLYILSLKSLLSH